MSSAAQIIPFVSCEEWRNEGLRLGERERSARSLMWDVGDWWNRGEAYGERAQVVTAGGWTGPKHQTCRIAGMVAGRWNVLMRVNTLTFDHYRGVASVRSDAEALMLLRWCEETDPPRSAEQMRAEIKRRKRVVKERDLGARQLAHPDKRYGVIYADPPWRFEPYSRVTGMDRAADNHYPTMDVPAICALQIPAADDCVLFLWATVPMLPEAMAVMVSWGFAYRSHFVWLKQRWGTGFWNRNKHELLLVGTRGEVPAPAMGEQFSSVIEAAATEHSAKPAAFAEMIEEMFPSLPAIEMFARGPRLGWDVWGNEAE
jgi:N6-adenosine-specific RNA methylase IME4